MLSIVSLFCGTGGLDLGFKELGFSIKYACDSDPVAVACYARNIDEHVVTRDVSSLQFREEIKKMGDCDVILGGFPCQGFSKAGPKVSQDKRNFLYLEMLWAVEILQPSLFIAENVDGISQNFNGSYLHMIVTDFDAIGYKVDYRFVEAAGFGLPQYRRRIVFVGTKKDSKDCFVWPLPSHNARPRNGESKTRLQILPLFDDMHARTTNLQPVATIRDAISDLIELHEHIPDHRVINNWPKKYEAVFRAVGQGQKLCNVRHASSSVYTWEIPSVFGVISEEEKMILEVISKNRRHKKYGNIPNGNPLPLEEITRLIGEMDITSQIGALLKKGYLKEVYKNCYDLKGAMFCSGIFKRPRWDEPSPTVLTNFYNPRYFLHPFRDRPFSLRECARLQGFPDNFVFTTDCTTQDFVNGYRLVGNAVPPTVSRVLAAATQTFLLTSKTKEVAA